MAVLIEAISLVIKREAIQRDFAGGWEAFLSSVPNGSFCSDEDLARVGFMDPTDVRAYVAALEAHGLTFQQEGMAVDLAVVDQLRGTTIPAPWLEIGRFHINGWHIVACWPKGSTPDGISFPAGWQYEGSISQRSNFVADEDRDDRVKFLRREDDIDVYEDLRTGKEVFIGRPEIQGGGEASVFTRIEKLFYDALDIETAMQPLAALGDTGALAPLCGRLERVLLAEASALAAGEGKHMAETHFVEGLILRILGRREAAETSFLQANALQPGSLNTLRELVRCLGEQGKHAAALPFARETVAAHPDDAGAWGNLALCLGHCGNKEEAAEALRQALILDPADPINRTIRDNFESYFGSD
jgi:hypothetical protein